MTVVSFSPYAIERVGAGSHKCMSDNGIRLTLNL